MTLNETYHCRTAEVNMIKPYESMCCGSPRAHVAMWSHSLDVRLLFGDDDDYEVAKMYICKDIYETEKVFYELINYLYDIEGKVFNYDWLYDETAFPDLGVPTKWELE